MFYSTIHVRRLQSESLCMIQDRWLQLQLNESGNEKSKYCDFILNWVITTQPLCSFIVSHNYLAPLVTIKVIYTLLMCFPFKHHQVFLASDSPIRQCNATKIYLKTEYITILAKPMYFLVKVARVKRASLTQKNNMITIIPSKSVLLAWLFQDLCCHATASANDEISSLFRHLTLRVLFFLRGSSFWTWRARVPKPRDCRDSVMKRCVGETHSITSSLASPPGGEQQEQSQAWDGKR